MMNRKKSSKTKIQNKARLYKQQEVMLKKCPNKDAA